MVWQRKEHDWQSQWNGKSTVEQQTMGREWLTQVEKLKLVAKQTRAKL